MRLTVTIASLFVALTSSAVAADVEVVASSILKTYSDYCDPLAFDRYGERENWDAEVAQTYARALVTKYLSDCRKFHTEQVAPAMIVPALIESTPLLQRDDARVLTKDQLTLLGGARRLRDMMALECEADAKSLGVAEAVANQIDEWAPSLVRGDALDYAAGFVGFEQYARYIVNIPADLYLPQDCGYLDQVRQVVVLYMINHGIPIRETPGADGSTTGQSQGMSSEEFDAWANGSSTDEAADVGQQAASPATHRDAISPLDDFAGRWGSTPTCDLPGSQYTIGRFELSDPTTFGIGAARIQAADLSCQLSDIKRFGATVTFEAECLGEGDTWRGTGSIQKTSQAAIDLFLFSASEPMTLGRCNALLPEPGGVAPIDLGFGN